MKGREAAARAIRAKATAAHADLAPMMAELRGEGLSLREIADVLNGEGHTTRQGAAWGPVQVARVLERAGLESKKSPGSRNVWGIYPWSCSASPTRPVAPPGNRSQHHVRDYDRSVRCDPPRSRRSPHQREGGCPPYRPERAHDLEDEQHGRDPPTDFDRGQDEEVARRRNRLVGGCRMPGSQRLGSDDQACRVIHATSYHGTLTSAHAEQDQPDRPGPESHPARAADLEGFAVPPGFAGTPDLGPTGMAKGNKPKPGKCLPRE